MENIFADTGYSSEENYAFFEQQNITSYIPPHGTYKGGPNDFIYNKEEKIITFVHKGKLYRSKKYF